MPGSHWKPLEASDRERLGDALATIEDKASTLVGYPCNQAFDYTELLPFLAYHMNNIGDPFAETNFGPNTHEFEREVIKTYSILTDAPKEDYWGYVTNGEVEDRKSVV